MDSDVVGRGGVEEEVELSALVCLFANFNRRSAREASSLCRASIALVSVGKTPWRNLSDNRCRALCMDVSSIFFMSSCRDAWSCWDSVAELSVGEAATAIEAKKRTKRKWKRRIMMAVIRGGWDG